MSSESIGKSVQLFLVDGTPGGLVTAGIMNWTGHILAAPRSKLSSLLKRQEAKRTGVYILLGDDPDGLGRPQAYIGESDDVSKRLIQHASQEPSSGKDFWNRAVTVTGKDAGLTKAHARYLESQFITLARTVNRAQLTNSKRARPDRVTGGRPLGHAVLHRAGGDPTSDRGREHFPFHERADHGRERDT